MALGLKQREKEGSKPLPTRHFSKLQEDAVAKAIGGKRTPNSGATTWVKSDKNDIQMTDDFKLFITEHIVAIKWNAEVANQ